MSPSVWRQPHHIQPRPTSKGLQNQIHWQWFHSLQGVSNTHIKRISLNETDIWKDLFLPAMCLAELWNPMIKTRSMWRASMLLIVCIYLYDVIYRFHFFYALCVSTWIVADMQDINEIVSTISTMMWHVFDVEYIFSSLYINALIKKDNHLNIFRFYYHWSSSWWRVYYILTFSSLAHPPDQNP